MNTLYKYFIRLILLMYIAGGIGYIFAPAAMLAVVAIPSNAETNFLLMTLGAALLAFTPAIWVVRNGAHTKEARGILAALALYAFIGSGVDLYGHLGGIVSSASIPSIAFRVVLGVALVLFLFGSKGEN